MEITKSRLREIENDLSTYTRNYSKFVSKKWFVMIDGTVDNASIHTTIIQPYVDKLCKNIERRFGDAVGEISVSSQLFCPDIAVKMNRKQQYEHVTALTRYFKMDSDTAAAEWTCFRNYIEKHKGDDVAMKKFFIWTPCASKVN